jgi:dienelactone hydrolase
MTHSRSNFLKTGLLAVLVATTAGVAFADEPTIRRGEVQFTPVANESQDVPKPFRLAAQKFAFEQKPQTSWTDGVAMSLVTFPSPVVTPEANNNTVHCEYFQPTTLGKHPAVIVLHILGGDFPLARVFANNFAQRGIAALFVKMPYYGERRQPGSPARMVSTDPEETARGMTQAVKDIRCAAAWLAAQDEVDSKQLGIFGISLGGITASLAAAAEPRFVKVCPTLAGGDLGLILRDSQEHHLSAARERWLAQGHSIDELDNLMKTIDPCCCLHADKQRKVLMLNAEHDEIIPRECTDRLCKAFGNPPVIWYDCGHYTAALHILDALQRTADFFADAKAEGKTQKAE